MLTGSTLDIAVDALQVTPQGAGVGRYVRELLGSLRDVLRSTERVTAFVQRGTLDVLPAPSSSLTYRVFPSGPTWQRIITQQVWLPSAAKGFDVVHFPDYLTPFFWRGTPFALTIHDMAYAADARFFTPGQQGLRRFANPWGVRRASHVMADSQFTRSELLRLFPNVSGSRVSVIYPGVPTFTTPANSAEVARRYRLPTRFVLSVGTLEPRKNVDSLLQAFARPELARESLVLVGREGWGPGLDGRLRAHPDLARRIFTTGHISDADLAALYREATAFAYVSLYEGFGFPLLEALSAGLPAVASDIPVLRETTRGAALYVDPKSPESIARGIRRLLDCSDLGENLRKAGEEVARTYTWRSCADAVISVYRELSARLDA
jgi:glycosyltransferase involved in cell wall biosynthesis